MTEKTEERHTFARNEHLWILICSVVSHRDIIFLASD